MEKSDRDIGQWDARLKEQLERSFHNYHVRRIDLSVARDNKQLDWTGETIIVEKASSAAAIATVRLMFEDADELTLQENVEIKSIFNRVYISNEVQADEWLDVIAGINFEYKKKIISPTEITGALNFLIGGPITTPAGVDLQIITGVDGILRIAREVQFYGYNTSISKYSANNSRIILRDVYQTVTVPVGQGAGGVVSGANLAPANSTIIGVVCRVTQAPGGGATTFDIGRTGAGNLDEFIDGIATAFGTTGTFAANHDAETIGPVLNDINRTLTITTDADVTVSDMKVLIVVFYRQEIPPTA